jgi:hypothetical protein
LVSRGGVVMITKEQLNKLLAISITWGMDISIDYCKDREKLFRLFDKGDGRGDDFYMCSSKDIDTFIKITKRRPVTKIDDEITDEMEEEFFRIAEVNDGTGYTPTVIINNFCGLCYLNKGEDIIPNEETYYDDFDEYVISLVGHPDD